MLQCYIRIPGVHPHYNTSEVFDMRRIFALPLAAALFFSLLAFPAAAVGTESSSQGSPNSPDPEGTVTWENLDSRIRSGSLAFQALLENISSVEAIDYDQMMDNLRTQINQIANAQWYTALSGGDSGSLDQTYASLRETFEDIKDGELQADNADVVWQLKDASNQVVAAGQKLYITLVGLEQSVQDLERQIAALDRQLTDARLREQLGRASAQTVSSLEQSRAQLVSQKESLNTTITKYKSQLQSLIGETPTGELTLGPLPTEADMDWTQPDYEADLASAKAASWTIRDAEATLADAKETWKDARLDYTGSKQKYLLEMAEHTWNSAQLTYQSTIQDFECSFKTLYQSLFDYEQVLETKKSALSYQETQLAVTQKKYELGLASYYDVLTAQDTVSAAQSGVDSAWRDLFTARNDYAQAVENGLLA